MADETDEESHTQFVIGILWSVIAIVVPVILLALNIWPVLMIGAVIGSSVRFVTDAVLMVVGAVEGGFSQLTGSYRLLTIAMVLVQFGTLLGGLGMFLYNGSTIGIGIFGSMIASYLFAIGMQTIYRLKVSPTGPQEQPSEDDEDEWKFGVDDV